MRWSAHHAEPSSSKCLVTVVASLAPRMLLLSAPTQQHSGRLLHNLHTKTHELVARFLRPSGLLLLTGTFFNKCSLRGTFIIFINFKTRFKMNKKLNSVLLAACVRLLREIRLCPCEPEYDAMLGVVSDIAKSMIAIQSGDLSNGLLPDVAFEALAYECKQSEPDPQLILILTECIQSNRIRQSSYFPH